MSDEPLRWYCGFCCAPGKDNVSAEDYDRLAGELREARERVLCCEGDIRLRDQTIASLRGAVAGAQAECAELRARAEANEADALLRSPVLGVRAKVHRL